MIILDEEDFKAEMRQMMREETATALDVTMRNVNAYSNRDRLIDRKEASEILGITVPFIDKLIREGKLRRKKIGANVRIKLSEVLRIMEDGVTL